MLAQKLIFNYSTKIILQFIRIIASIIVARIAGPNVMGTVAFGVAYVSMFSSISDLGFGTAHMKKVSEGEDVEKCLGTFVRIKLLLIFAYVLVVVGFFISQKYLFNVDFESKEHIIVIFIILGSMVIECLFAIPKTTFSAYTQVAKTNIPNLVKIFIYQILRIIVVVLGYRAIALAVGQLMATIIIVPIYYYFFREFSIGKYDKELAKKYLKIAMPVMLIGIATKLTATIDKVLLQFFTNSEQVGYYSAGYRIAGFVLMIGQSVNNLFFPTFSKDFSENNPHKIQNKLKKFERFSFVFVMPAVIILTLNADIIIKVVLGKEYLPSIDIMRVINIAMFLMVANIPFGTVITGKGDFKTSAKLNVFNFIIFGISIIFLVHPKLLDMAGLGTAISRLISYLFLGIICRIYAKKYISTISHFEAIKYMLFGVINYLVFSYLIQFQFIGNIIIFRLIFSLIYGIVTYTALFILGFFKIDDLHYLKTLIDIRSVGNYVKDEIGNKNNENEK